MFRDFYKVTILTLIAFFALSNIHARTVYSNDSSQYKVYIFVSETCPICLQMTPQLRTLLSKYNSKRIDFELVFPNPKSSDISSISEYMTKYNLICPYIIDKRRKMTHKYDVKITPEIILLDKQINRILYRGKLDNQYEGLGKKRTIITEHYLEQALDQVIKGETVTIPYTEPIGCFLLDE